jgi:preprotein translocase SecE subunit
VARNDDRARQRRAKRRGENPESEAPEGADSTPEVVDDAAPGADLTKAEAVEGEGIGETARAENEAREGIVGSPIDFSEPTDASELTDFDPPPGKLVVGGEITPTKKGGPRFVQFLRASWAELQRVIWPNRQQVAQGTAVTLGFVLIAGVYLGIADVIARQIVNFII